MAQRRKWECVSVERQFKAIPDQELRERLAEVMDLLINKKSQLPKSKTSFSVENLCSESAPGFRNKKHREKSA
jgi:hypothetical protein